MEVTSLLGQLQPNFNCFTTVCLQPELTFAEGQNLVEYVNCEGTDDNEQTQNEGYTQDPCEDSNQQCDINDLEEKESASFDGENKDEAVKPKVKRVRHTPEEYRCDSCPYTCTTERAFLKHCTSKRCGAGKSRHSCPICGKDRSSKELLSVHMEKHKRDKRYCCDICQSYQTVQLMKLIQHRRMHTGEKPHLCPFCNYRSSRRDNLKSHVKRVHKESSLPGDTFAPRTIIITPSKCKQ